MPVTAPQTHNVNKNRRRTKYIAPDQVSENPLPQHSDFLIYINIDILELPEYPDQKLGYYAKLIYQIVSFKNQCQKLRKIA